MQATVSGVKVRGQWEEVVNESKAVTEALEAADAADDLEEWEDWRPHQDDRFDKDVRQRTVENACVAENAVEAAGKSATNEAGEAVEHFGRAVGQAANGQRDAVSAESREAVKGVFRSLDTAARKAMRRVEQAVYHHVVTRTNPYFFQNDTVAASLQQHNTLRAKTGKADREYTMHVSIRDDAVEQELKEQVAERS